MTIELSESQITAEIANARRDIEARLNALEQRTGRSVMDLSLHRVEVTTLDADRRTYIRTVQISVAPALAKIGSAA